MNLALWLCLYFYRSKPFQWTMKPIFQHFVATLFRKYDTLNVLTMYHFSNEFKCFCSKCRRLIYILCTNYYGNQHSCCQCYCLFPLTFLWLRSMFRHLLVSLTTLFFKQKWLICVAFNDNMLGRDNTSSSETCLVVVNWAYV